MENHNEKTYEMKQYELCLEWFEFMTNDLFIGDKYSVQECNVLLGQFMTTMERAFEIPLLSGDFELWSLDHPEVSGLYRKASDARDFSIYPDAFEDTFQLDRNGDSCINCNCYDADYGQCTMPAIDLVYACPDESKETGTDNIVVNLGKRIKRIREARGMSRSELGEVLELNNPDIRIGSYENGKKFPQMQMLINIANALGVSWQWLMTGRINSITYMAMNDLGYRLKKVRKARRMTRKEIGDLIGINYADTRLDAYETGKTYPREKMLNKIAEALEVSSSWLATGELDNQTMKSLEEKGIFHLVFEPFSEEIKCFYQFRDFLDKNKSVIENTLTIEDYKILTNIIVNKID